jgi:hypothetical protein
MTARDTNEEVASAWASIDGKLHHFELGKKDPGYEEIHGHYEGYLSEASELRKRLLKRGYAIVPVEAGMPVMEWRDDMDEAKKHKSVIVMLGNGEVFRAFWTIERGWLAASDIGWVDAKWWMPLPTPPNEYKSISETPGSDDKFISGGGE